MNNADQKKFKDYESDAASSISLQKHNSSSNPLVSKLKNPQEKKNKSTDIQKVKLSISSTKLVSVKKENSKTDKKSTVELSTAIDKSQLHSNHSKSYCKNDVHKKEPSIKVKSTFDKASSNKSNIEVTHSYQSVDEPIKKEKPSLHLNSSISQAKLHKNNEKIAPKNSSSLYQFKSTKTSAFEQILDKEPTKNLPIKDESTDKFKSLLDKPNEKTTETSDNKSCVGNGTKLTSTTSLKFGKVLSKKPILQSSVSVKIKSSRLFHSNSIDEKSCESPMKGSTSVGKYGIKDKLDVTNEETCPEKATPASSSSGICLAQAPGGLNITAADLKSAPNDVDLETGGLVASYASSCSLYDVPIGSHQIPIIYRPEYNISLFGLERLHPFDSGKWGKVIQLLKEKRLLADSSLVQPLEASKMELLKVHKQRYLASLKWSVNVAQITEIGGAALLPNCLLQRKLLRPFRYQTGGSVLAGRCAVERGWSINVGGGFHHCSGGRGGGFCAYADITLTVHVVLAHYEHINKVAIVDLDAHQGNGHERDFMGRADVYILDVYNRLIYPRDEHAKKAINKKVELSPYTEDTRYLQAVETPLEICLNEFEPDLVVYNAGTDILDGDPLGLLSVSSQGVIARDEMVWRKARQRGIPVIMLTSGGYQRCTAITIADSIANLHSKGLIDLQPTTLGRKTNVTESGKGQNVSNSSSPKSKKLSSASPPFKYGSFLSRCGGGTGGGGANRKQSSHVSASESSTPLSGRYSVTDSTTSSPPPPVLSQFDQQETADNYDIVNISNVADVHKEAPTITQQQPPSFINIRPDCQARHSIVSPGSADYATPRSTIHPILAHTHSSAVSPGTPCSSSLHPSMTQQASITDSLTPPSPAYRSVAGSIHTVHSSNTPPPHHKSLESTLSITHYGSINSQHTGGSITTPPSHYESADSMERQESLVSNNVFTPS